MVLKAIVSSREAYFRLLQLLLVFGLGLVHAGQAWAELTTIKLPLSGGHELEVLIHTPAQAEQPLPAVVIFGGLEAGAGVLNVVAGQAPVVAASFAYPYQPPAKLGWGNALGAVDDFGQGVDRTFDGIAQLMALLRSRADVDPRRITLVGASAGAPFASISAARLNVPGLVVVQGFGDVPSVLARQGELALRKRERELWIPLLKPVARLLSWWLELPAPERYAPQLRTGQRVLMITAQDDERVPAAAADLLWDGFQASGAQATRLDLPGAHLRGLGDPTINEILVHALRWMQAQDLL